VRFPVVLFDFDGTIVDSGAIISASFLQVAKEAGLALTPEQLPDVYRVGPLEAQMASLDAARTDELTARYRVINAALHADLVAFPGMMPLLETLRAEGRRLGLVTSKLRKTVDLAFETLPLAHLFDVVVGSDDTAAHKPDPAPILHALERLGAAAGEAAYVGDAPMDVEAARAAGVHAVAVTWGGLFPAEQTLAARPDAVAHTPEELLALL
jgi:pyrophosphatase PpaX